MRNSDSNVLFGKSSSFKKYIKASSVFFAVVLCTFGLSAVGGDSSYKITEQKGGEIYGYCLSSGRSFLARNNDGGYWDACGSGKGCATNKTTADEAIREFCQ